MSNNAPRTQPHKSARLGVMSMTLGFVGMIVCYLGLWIKSDIVGLMGYVVLAFSVIGILSSLVWAIAARVRNVMKPDAN